MWPPYRHATALPTCDRRPTCDRATDIRPRCGRAVGFILLPTCDRAAVMRGDVLVTFGFSTNMWPCYRHSTALRSGGWIYFATNMWPPTDMWPRCGLSLFTLCWSRSIGASTHMIPEGSYVGRKNDNECSRPRRGRMCLCNYSPTKN